MSNSNIPAYRAKIDIYELAKGNNVQDYLYRVIRHYVNRGTIIKVESEEYDYTNEDKYYVIGKLNSYGEIEVFDSQDKQILKYPYFEDTLAIQMGKRKLFMSLDIETGKGGDKISDNEVLVWNDEMMNCSILEIMDNGVNEYEITLDNFDFDKMQAIGIQK